MPKNSAKKRQREEPQAAEPEFEDNSDDSDAAWVAPPTQNSSDEGSDDGGEGSAAEEAEVSESEDEAADLEIDYTVDRDQEEGAGDDEDSAVEQGSDKGDAGVGSGTAVSDAAARAAAHKKERQLAKFKRFGEALARRGVVYLSRVPPFMKPDKVRHLLEQYGEITRLYLVPEDAAVARRRKKLGGQRTTNYVEGWIEFADKKVAKGVARSLHMQKIGGKKRSFYREDLWNLKYLRHFTWSHLTEKKAYERRVREHKLRLEMVTAKKQNEEFRQLVDKGKAQRAIEGRRAAKQGSGGGGGAAAVARGGSEEGHAGKRLKVDPKKDGASFSGGMSGGDLAAIKRRFHQHKPLTPGGSGPALESAVLNSALGRSHTKK